MRRRTFLQGAGAAIAAAPPRPNVIVILVDDQGYGDFGCHGNPRLRTPHLDALHRQSTRLTNFHSAPVCTPTRSQFITGRDALANGASSASSGRSMMRRDLPTVADVLAASGRRTALFGKWHCGDRAPYRPGDRGFEDRVWHPGYGLVGTPCRWNNDYFDPCLLAGDQWRQFPGYCTDVLFTQAIDWMAQRAARREPFFAYLATDAPHSPQFVPGRYRRVYDGLPLRLASFFGMIANLDENVGRLEEFLEKSGLRDDTILVYATDNGSSVGSPFFNAGMKGAKGDLHDGGHRAACFLRWPGGRLRPPGDVAVLAQFQDLLPTLADLCGVPVPRDLELDGVSLAPTLRGEPQPTLDRRMAVVQYTRDTGEAPAKWDAAVLFRNWRLVRGQALYEVGYGPGQTRDVAAQHREIAERMRDYYEKWWSHLAAVVPNPPPVFAGSVKGAATVFDASSWIGPALDEQREVRAGVERNGYWNLHLEAAGDYRIELRRWPAEIDLPLRAGLPPFRYRDEAITGFNPPGKALDIARAGIEAGAFRAVRPVAPLDSAAAFRVRLGRGQLRLRTAFFDAEGRELCGAYYVAVTRR